MIPGDVTARGVQMSRTPIPSRVSRATPRVVAAAVEEQQEQQEAEEEERLAQRRQRLAPSMALAPLVVGYWITDRLRLANLTAQFASPGTREHT